ncbi:PREDICTED: uncharacterized protein DDB_G0290587-like [Polistes dominula]|uniref:Uncharacterized protein DDB_G0290587-like n=1 Tax=Polistes dominula TaxID=743375 RepID=A0ABM1I7U5_POLDO|nr:PREDICTED: uncharacterized protein DDB_G0290587-like [Polistes dominula]
MRLEFLIALLSNTIHAFLFISLSEISRIYQRILINIEEDMLKQFWEVLGGNTARSGMSVGSGGRAPIKRTTGTTTSTINNSTKNKSKLEPRPPPSGVGKGRKDAVSLLFSAKRPPGRKVERTPTKTTTTTTTTTRTTTKTPQKSPRTKSVELLKTPLTESKPFIVFRGCMYTQYMYNTYIQYIKI